MSQNYVAKYLTKAALSAPRDFANAVIARYKPIRPTVLIFHCTFVCDARCEMCSNWKRGDRKSDMTTEQIRQVFKSDFWAHIENASISGGEPTTRNDLVDIARVMTDSLPRLRKLTLNTTGLTPNRAIPMLTEIARVCADSKVILSIRVSIDGIGDMHDAVRNVKRGFDKANQTIRAMQALQKELPFNFGISSTIFSQNLDDAENMLAWARREGLDIVFNMVRVTDAMLGNQDVADKIKPSDSEEERMRRFFLDRVRMDPLLDGQNYVYMHYADMIANGYHRLAPCPFQTQGVMINPDGGLFICENSEQIGNVLAEDPGAIYFRESSQAHRRQVRDQHCPTCLSPCQMNIAAIKQVVPYVRFLARASNEKRRYRRSSDPRSPSPASPVTPSGRT